MPGREPDVDGLWIIGLLLFVVPASVLAPAFGQGRPLPLTNGALGVPATRSPTSGSSIPALVLTSVAGPRRRRYLAGAPIRSQTLWEPESGKLSLGVSIFSYAGEVILGSRMRGRSTGRASSRLSSSGHSRRWWTPCERGGIEA